MGRRPGHPFGPGGRGLHGGFHRGFHGGFCSGFCASFGSGFAAGFGHRKDVVVVLVPWGWGFFGSAFGFSPWYPYIGYGPYDVYDPYAGYDEYDPDDFADQADPYEQQRDTTPRPSAADSTVRELQRTRGVRAADPLLPWQVDQPAARLDSASGPEYPALLANRRIPGRVLAQFVVDAAGRPDSASLRILLATDRAFADAVAAWLPTSRWRPARRGGVAVTAIAEETFIFR